MKILPKLIIGRVSVKNIKKNFGHDLNGFYCDIYLDKRKVGYFNDDGWGGEPDVNLTNEAKTIIHQLFVDSGFKKDIETECFFWCMYTKILHRNIRNNITCYKSI